MTTDLIAVVTGSSRGVGKGIAIALGETGATVYVTGRSTKGTESPSLFSRLANSIGLAAQLRTRKN